MNFDATLEALPAMLLFIRRFFQKEGVESAFIRKVELASEEALVNTITHGYREEEKGQLQIACERRKEKEFEVEISDNGLPFNPLEYEFQSNHLVPIEERKIGGLGIMMMRRICKEMIYERLGDKNRLKLLFEEGTSSL